MSWIEFTCARCLKDFETSAKTKPKLCAVCDYQTKNPDQVVDLRKPLKTSNPT